jgi:GrpB-like predicted nucleotidyltransferase (UPF0157 family)
MRMNPPIEYSPIDSRPLAVSRGPNEVAAPNAGENERHEHRKRENDLSPDSHGPIILVDSNPAWPEHFARQAERIQAALGERALRIEHVGSTSVLGLVAKPIIDILLAVADSADEPSYVPALEAAGFVLRIREPNWHEHRLFKDAEIDLNLHVFSVSSAEIERLLLLRDRLRENPAERQLYELTKRELASRTWKYVQDYADAKSEVIEGIISRARAQMTSGHRSKEH